MKTEKNQRLKAKLVATLLAAMFMAISQTSSAQAEEVCAGGKLSEKLHGDLRVFQLSSNPDFALVSDLACDVRAACVYQIALPEGESYSITQNKIEISDICDSLKLEDRVVFSRDDSAYFHGQTEGFTRYHLARTKIGRGPAYIFSDVQVYDYEANSDSWEHVFGENSGTSSSFEMMSLTTSITKRSVSLFCCE